VQALTADEPAMHAAITGMPRLDSLFFPGGDGGQLSWPDILATGAVLRAAHKGAGAWVSAQELTTAGMEGFWGNVSAASRAKQLAGARPEA
jgi:hypothetical protein